VIMNRWLICGKANLPFAGAADLPRAQRGSRIKAAPAVTPAVFRKLRREVLAGLWVWL